MKLACLVMLSFALGVSCKDHVNPVPVSQADDDDGDDTGDDDDTADAAPPKPDASSATDAGKTDRSAVIRVATYNTHLFFDTHCDSGKCGTGDFENVPSQAQFDDRVEKLAAAIQTIDADVIALEELETEACLTAVNQALAARGVDYPIAVFGETNFPASVDVAILARGTNPKVTKHRNDDPDVSFTRELLEVELTFAGATVDMFAAHFRSKNDDDPERRLAEATAAGKIVTKAGTDRPNAYVVLGGDLNDTPGSDAIDALEDSGQLLRLAADLPVDDQGTDFYNGHFEAIDHLYGAGKAKQRYVPLSAYVLRDNARSFGDSDHCALRADLAL